MAIRQYNIDPETGLLLDDTYAVFNSDGSIVKVDAEGNVIFNDTPLIDAGLPATEDSVAILRRKRIVDVDSVRKALNTKVSELTRGSKDSINTPGPFESLCNVIVDILDGAGNNDGRTQIQFNPNNPDDPNPPPIDVPGNTFDDVVRLIERFREVVDELNSTKDRCSTLEGQLEESENIGTEAASELDDLLELVEALNSCKIRLEKANENKTDIIQTLTSNLHESEQVNEHLETLIKDQEENIRILTERIQENLESEAAYRQGYDAGYSAGQANAIPDPTQFVDQDATAANELIGLFNSWWAQVSNAYDRINNDLGQSIDAIQGVQTQLNAISNARSPQAFSIAFGPLRNIVNSITERGFNRNAFNLQTYDNLVTKLNELLGGGG